MFPGSIFCPSILSSLFCIETLLYEIYYETFLILGLHYSPRNPYPLTKEIFNDYEPCRF